MGEACADLRHQLDIAYPVNNGIVQNWDDMGHVWDHAFYNELKVKFPLLMLFSTLVTRTWILKDNHV